MTHVTRLISFCLCLFIASTANGQFTPRVNIVVSYGIDFPALDMNDRFGFNFNPAIDLDYATADNYFFGVHAHMLLGSFVDEDVISNLRTSEGRLIGQQRNTSILTLKQRGFIFGVHGGKLINFSNNQDFHGLKIRLGTSVMSHYIVFNDESATLNQLLGSYAQGYDRFSRGITAEEFIGYQYISKSGRIDVHAGFSFIQGFTRNRRPVNFDTGITDHSLRFDFLQGIRVGIAVKLYEMGNGEDIFY